MDLLLVPFAHSGYVTRLFFAHKIERPRRQLEPAPRRRAQLVGAVLEPRARLHALDADALRASEGRRMNIRFKITSALARRRSASTCGRPHPFAHERVGFIAAGLGRRA